MMDKNKVKAFKFLLMEIFTLENMSQGVLKVMESIIGKMVHITEVNFCQEWGMGEGSGRWSMETLIKESIWTTKRMEKEFISGKMGQDIKEILKMIIDMDMARWSGKMGGLTKENGWMELKKISW